jgi:FKBP-type peptidyl-prolyl cis-trans isomerase SlyD
MKISSGKVVSMQYVLTDSKGVELDRSAPGEPLAYLHGEGQIVPGLEKQLEGLSKGDKRDKLEIKPADGYGEVEAELRTSLERSKFPADMDVKPGMQFMMQSPDGHRRPFVVTGVTSEQVEIDGNHPLAGQTLYFQIEISDVRDATPEELQHGHVHGPGGHHH